MDRDGFFTYIFTDFGFWFGVSCLVVAAIIFHGRGTKLDEMKVLCQPHSLLTTYEIEDREYAVCGNKEHIQYQVSK